MDTVKNMHLQYTKLEFKFCEVMIPSFAINKQIAPVLEYPLINPSNTLLLGIIMIMLTKFN